MTPDGENLGQLWRDARYHLEVACARYCAALNELLKPDLAERVVTGRVKSGRSIVRKIHGNPQAYPTWDSVHDKVGLRVTCSTLADCELVVDQLSGHFEVKWVDRKTGASDQLFYPGIHVQLLDVGLVDHRGMPIEAEVQVRTRAQDAWAVISHKFLYKAGIPSPPKVERMIKRLVAVMEMFDDDVERAAELRDAHRKEDPMLDVKLYAETLEDAFQDLLDEPAIVVDAEAILPQLLASYTDGQREELDRMIDDYVTDNRDMLRELLERHQPAAAAFDSERDWLFCTPEVLVVLERAANARWLLHGAVQRTDLWPAVQRVCAAAAMPLPEPD